ncbi:extracellular catalytic domain type 1 short-chain-length polyhydroxyalkanoate depolymerase [Aquimarina pacifica]|uniref:extracellular catalytic domain type 1 short-chain-length polyhydroxyalkanoate depolymerase n=1 Tax=Aquimarina pacifica TaxID=1296415 RepID=UPI0004715E05|nr:PHB depolymerase family esterase [Aquimarina pacifica]
MINFKLCKSAGTCISKSIFLLFLFATTFVSAQETINASITHDGLERDYILYVPANYTGKKPVPLVFNFHGYTSNATEQMFYGDFRPIADREGFIIVHPEGTLDYAGNTHFNVGWGGSTVDDIGFTAALLDTISSQYKVNHKRVYSTGMSNGGFMSYTLACTLSNRIAAIASVTGTMNVGQDALCSPDRPVPVMEIHGTNDLTVPYEGTDFFQDTESVIDYWVAVNNTKSTPKIINIPDTNTTDGSTVEHFIYKRGDRGVQVELFKIIGGGHTWPGSAFDLGIGTNYDINASEEVWKFFSRYDINGRIRNHYRPRQNGCKVNVFHNATNAYITVDNDFSENTPYKIISAKGKVVSTGEISKESATIDISNLSSKMYFLKIKNNVYKVLKTK